MERQFIFRDSQDLGSNDFNVLQGFTSTSLEHVVGDGITAERKYAGFGAAATGVTQLTVQPGRLYAGGKAYVRDTVFTQDFTTSLPIAAKKIVRLVAFGTEVDTAAAPREFLIDEETGASEPRVVATERARIANVNVVQGQENADPLPPIVDAGVLVIADILLGPAGIVSVTMIADNRLDSVQSLAERADRMDAFEASARPQIGALSSDIAALKFGIGNTVDQASLGRVLVRLATVEAKAGVPVTALSSAADFFLDPTASDTTYPEYYARVEEGLRFPTAASADSALTIFNALDPKVKIIGGLMLPAFDSELRLSSGARQGEVQVNAYTYQEHDLVERTISRQRLRYGYTYTYSPSVAWWVLNGFNYWKYTYGFNGEVWGYYDAIGFQTDRRDYYWADSVDELYWDKVTVNHTVPGAQVAETFLCANSGWLTHVGLTFTRLAAAGGITLLLCKTQRGMPDLDNVVSITTIDRASLAVNAETKLPITPTFLEGGERYAIVVITASDHWLATTNGENFAQGTFFYVLDGAYQQGDATRDLAFALYFAKFRAARAVVDLQPLALPGGITDIDLLHSAIVPGSTDLSFEVQANNVWQPLVAGTPAINAGGVLPPLLPLRAVFTGTPDVMPGLKTAGSRANVSRPSNVIIHFSNVRNLPAPSTQIRVILRLEKYDPAHHSAYVLLRTGAGYQTAYAASSTTSVPTGEGAVELTAVFNLGAPVTSFRIQIGATTDSPLRTFNIASRKDYAL